MDLNLVRLGRDRTIEALAGVVILAFFLERALDVVLHGESCPARLSEGKWEAAQ